ncbi:MAG: hypothetical protein JO304_05560 [Solirubrobacterales bacterium]|nr:hypothetical protein [Solirubrobacterales bacterium]
MPLRALLDEPRLGPGRRLALPRGADALLLVVVFAFAGVLLDILPSSLNDDSWLDLTAGRLVWQTGIPHHDTLTAMAHGGRWVNQQWLSQLFTYLLDRVGGLGLVGVMDVAMMALGVGIAIAAARRLGARPLSVILLLPLCLIAVLAGREVRAQAYALPLLASTILLLALDSRHPSRRVYWCLPILILWGNLHGTAILGAALVGLRALTMLWERRRRLLREWTAWRRPLLLGVGAPLCLLLTPYGTQMISYYHATAGSAALRHLVTEWQPITAVTFLAVPFFILAAILVWSFGRAPSRTTPWEKLATLLLAAITIGVLRNAILFGLCALVIGPVSIDEVVGRWRRRSAPERKRLNAVIVAAALIALIAGIAVTLSRPETQLEIGYQRTQIIQVVRTETARDPSLQVFADVRFADWLLWNNPALAGRIAYDTRFELLSPAQMNSMVALFSAIGPDWKHAARGDRLLVLDRADSPETVRAFLAEAGRRILYDDGTRIIILRAAREAMAS